MSVWDWDAPLVTIRVPRRKTMTEPTLPNRYNTATVVAFVGATFVVLDPMIQALGHWMQGHSSIVFPPDYMQTLKQYVEMAVVVWTVHYHTQEPTPPTVP